MIFSQVLLTAFVLQWIISQYNNKKSELQKELTQQFEKSQEEVLDTLLEKNLITPLLKNKNGFKISLHENNIDTFPGNGKLKMFFNKTEKTDSTEIVTVLTDSINTNKNVTITKETNSTNDILLHGVRLIVKEVTGDARHRRELEQRLYSASDTTLLKNLLSQRFKGNGWDFNTKWVSGKQDDSSGHRDKIIYMESSIFPKNYGFEVAGYHFYLLRQILPQAVFAVILLMLTGFAFIISHRSLKKQLRLNTMKNDFIDNISHELKTPLSTVKVVIEALQDENIRKDEKTIKEYLEMASIEISRLELLTGKVLSTSMMESGKIKIQKQKIDLHKLISYLIYAMKVRLTNEHAEVTVDTPEENFYIQGDPLHIQGALLNILDNSLKYSDSPRIIKITLYKNSEGIIVRIKDNGPGIPQEYLKKVFEKFFRVPSGNLHNIKGYGLGLSYVDMVMKMHDGKVFVENDLKTGCVFTLIFPVSSE